MLNIIVCIKQVLDPEAPSSTYKVDEASNRMTQKGVPPLMSPFDENALEAALRIKSSQAAKITVLSMGSNLSKQLLRKALAAGADELILIEDALLENLDSFANATILAAGIKKIGNFDLVLTGRQAADWNAGVVGSGIAELLTISSVSTARKVEIIDGKARVECVTSDGYEVIESSLPALVTVSSELGGLRSIALKEIMAAQKKPITIWTAGQLGIDIQHLSRSRILSLYIPQSKTHCEIVSGLNAEEIAVNLALRLKDKNVIL